MLFSVRLGTDKSRTVIGLYGFFVAYKLLYSSSVTGSHHSFDTKNQLKTIQKIEHNLAYMDYAMIFCL